MAHNIKPGVATGDEVQKIFNYAKEKGIPVVNVPTYGTQIVGQFAVGLLLEICSHYQYHSDTVKAGKWENNDLSKRIFLSLWI